MSGSDADQKPTFVNLNLGNRTLELRKAPACRGSGYIGFYELYLDRKYEGYIGIPERGGTHVMIYGRSQAPESQVPYEDDGESQEEKSRNSLSSWISRILNRKTGG